MHRLFIYISFIFLFSSCQKRIQQFAYQKNDYYRFDNKIVNADSAVLKVIQPYKTKLDLQMNEVIGYNEKEMTKGKPASSLTNFGADAVKFGYEKTTGKKIDALIMNFGGIRLPSLGAGDITVGEMYEIMPFDNIIITMELPQKELMLLFNKIAKAEGWPISEGSGFTIKDSMATNIIIDNKPFDSNKTYTIGMPDYIANGGDDCSFLINLPRTDSGLLMRDMIIKYVHDTKKIIGDNTLRIKK